MMYVQVSRPGQGSYVDEVKNLPDILDGEFDMKEVGSKVCFEFIEMDEAEYAKLKEFDGW